MIPVEYSSIFIFFLHLNHYFKTPCSCFLLFCNTSLLPPKASCSSAYMPLRAQFAEIRTFAHRFQLRVLLKKLPRLVFRVVANFLLPRTALASPVSCVGMQRGVGYFVSVCVSFHTFKSFSVSPFYKFYFCFYFVYITRVVVAQSYNVITHAPNSCGTVVM